MKDAPKTELFDMQSAKQHISNKTNKAAERNPHDNQVDLSHYNPVLLLKS